ncbi:replication-relaxation family protein [Paucisalibacillus globulus]|uniref:replication-relaxation family protein n=1 Tax=Paucisalibacillus globulus TaxID=351095 RepID=UPI0020D024DF|nr:replication-relaxation family protein [Paucisalibacillus globulus]
MRPKTLERQEQILLSLKNLDYLTVKQIQILHGLGFRNTYRILDQMEPYLNHFYDGQKIYYLSKEGREKINCSTIRTKIITAKHYLMRNDLYIQLNQPKDWKNEVKLISGEGTKAEIVVIPDARFIRNGKYHIIEIDNQQKMKKNKVKIDKYRRFIERNSFKGMPKIIWVTTTPYRRDSLLELCEGLDVDVFLDTDIN